MNVLPILYSVAGLCLLLVLALTKGSNEWLSTKDLDQLLIASVWVLIASLWFCSGAIVGAIKKWGQKQTPGVEPIQSIPMFQEGPKKRRIIRDLTNAEIIGGSVVIVFAVLMLLWLIGLLLQV